MIYTVVHSCRKQSLLTGKSGTHSAHTKHAAARNATESCHRESCKAIPKSAVVKPIHNECYCSGDTQVNLSTIASDKSLSRARIEIHYSCHGWKLHMHKSRIVDITKIEWKVDRVTNSRHKPILKLKVDRARVKWTNIVQFMNRARVKRSMTDINQS